MMSTMIPDPPWKTNFTSCNDDWFAAYKQQLYDTAGYVLPNPESLELGQNGILFLQDGISNRTSRRFVDDELKQTCGNGGLQFEGGTVAVRRRALVSNTDVRFEYELLHGTNNSNNNVAECLAHQTNNNNNNEESACEHRVPVYPDTDWRKNLSGIFSTRVYEQ